MMHEVPTVNRDDRVNRLGAGLSAFVADRLGRSVEVSNVRRLSGGASHATWAFDVIDDSATFARLVMRQEFETPLIEAGDISEFDLLVGLHRLGLPVPEPFWASTHRSDLGASFMILERLAGGDARKLLARRDTALDRASFFNELVATQAAIHAVDWQNELQGIVARPKSWCAAGELDRWTKLVESRSAKRSAILAAAIAWLRNNTPADLDLVLVHGDYKTNNILTENGRIAVADWEMAHISDPLEDLAWTMMWTTDFDLVGGLSTASEYLAAYEKCSGRIVDPSRLFFWRLFSHVKLSAILIGGVQSTMLGGGGSPTLGLLGRGTVSLDAAMCDLLSATVHGDRSA